MIRKQNEEKLFKEREKEEKFRQTHYVKQNEENNKTKLKELNKKEQFEREKGDRNILHKEQIDFEKNKIKEDLISEKQQILEANLNIDEDKIKQDDLKLQIERKFEDNQIKTNDQFKKSEGQKIKVFETNKMIIMNNNLIKKEEKLIKIKRTMSNLEERLRIRNEEFELKQKKNDDRRIKFEILRNIAIKNQIINGKKKSKEILKVLEKNIELEKRKIKEYNDKQEIIALRKEEMEEIYLEERISKEEKISLRKQKIEDVFFFNLIF